MEAHGWPWRSVGHVGFWGAAGWRPWTRGRRLCRQLSRGGEPSGGLTGGWRRRVMRSLESVHCGAVGAPSTDAGDRGLPAPQRPARRGHPKRSDPDECAGSSRRRLLLAVPGSLTTERTWHGGEPGPV